MAEGMNATVAALMVASPGLTRLHCPWCPFRIGHRDLSVTPVGDGVFPWLCHRCLRKGCVHPRDFGEAFTESVVRLAVPRPSAAPPGRLTPAAESRWLKALPIDRPSIAASYLNSRACRWPAPGADVRWMPSVTTSAAKIVDGVEMRMPYSGPALVLLVRDLETRLPMTLQTIWVHRDGSKATPGKRFTPGLPKRGGVVFLTRELRSRLVVGEGLETVLSAMEENDSALVCLDCGGLEALRVLTEVQALTIAVDFDAAGIHAAEVCARRWHDSGRDVSFLLPPAPHLDANDCRRLGLPMLRVPFDPAEALPSRVLRMLWARTVPVVEVPKVGDVFRIKGWRVPPLTSDLRVLPAEHDPLRRSTTPRLAALVTDDRGIPVGLELRPLKRAAAPPGRAFSLAVAGPHRPPVGVVRLWTAGRPPDAGNVCGVGIGASLRSAHGLSVSRCVLSMESLIHLTPSPGPEPLLIVASTESAMEAARATAERLNSMGHLARAALLEPVLP